MVETEEWEVLNPGSYAVLEIKGINQSPNKVQIYNAQEKTVYRTLNTKAKWTSQRRMWAWGSKNWGYKSFTNTNDKEYKIQLACTHPLNIEIIKLSEFPTQEIRIKQDAFFAANEKPRKPFTTNIFKAFVQRRSMFVLKLEGEKGNLAIRGAGTIQKMTLEPGESIIVDNGLLLAWTKNLRIQTITGTKMAGEWLMLKLSSKDNKPATFWVQSHEYQMPSYTPSSGSTSKLGSIDMDVDLFQGSDGGARKKKRTKRRRRQKRRRTQRTQRTQRRRRRR